ncbi:MAG: adenylate/guanylate cyclase domain-containing protein [Proteobacteria bacterium]|nr:adenylate/guanylate cyclase domain-containing protein [Pseudomonadota bacterium]
MAQERVERRLAAIFAADVVGYSRLVAMDEEGTIARLKSLREELVDPAIAKHQGRIVKTTGDGLLVEFPSVVDAVRCCISVQRQMAARNVDEPETTRIEFRIGVNIGDIIVEGEDIHGGGVNIAARLEQIAAPGGIIISAAAFDQVRGRLDFAHEDLGPQELKNIPEPVRVYRVIVGDDGTPPAVPDEAEPFPLPDEPSIAILAFDNLSGDPDQEYFADGIVEEITAALSKVRSFFVIARNSSFAFKGKPTDIKQVSRRLGVRYVLEGSVRKSGNRVRITAQLIDGTNGRHVWADRFDGTLEDIFDLQDQIAESVVGAIEPKLRASEIERSRRKPTTNLNAYDYFLRALPHAHAMTQEGNEEALRLASRAIALDPRYASAMALAAWCYTLRVAQGWVDATHDEAHEALRLARAAIEVDKDVPEILWLAGYVLGFFGHTPEEGIDLIDDALRLNPNSAQALVYSGWLRVYDGDATTAKAHFERALRLSPLDSSAYRTYAGLAFSCLFLGQIDDAVSWASKALHHNPKFTPTHRVLAASLGHAGRLDEAHRVVEQLQALVPGLTVTRFGKETRVRHPEYFELLMDGLRKAGLPE